MSTPVSTTFDGLASVDRYGNLAPIVVDRLDERYQAGGEAAASLVNAVVTDPATPAGELVAGKLDAAGVTALAPRRGEIALSIHDYDPDPANIASVLDKALADGAAQRRAVHLGKGTWTTAKPGAHQIKSFSGLVGDPGGGTTLQLRHADARIHIEDALGPGNAYVYEPRIRDISIDGYNVANRLVTGKNLSEISMDRVRLQGWTDAAMDFDAVGICNMRTVAFAGNDPAKVGLRLRGTVGAVELTSPNIWKCTGIEVATDTVNDLRINGQPWVEHCTDLITVNHPTGRVSLSAWITGMRMVNTLTACRIFRAIAAGSNYINGHLRVYDANYTAASATVPPIDLSAFASTGTLTVSIKDSKIELPSTVDSLVKTNGGQAWNTLILDFDGLTRTGSGARFDYSKAYPSAGMSTGGAWPRPLHLSSVGGPEGVIAAPPGSIYQRQDGAMLTYRKRSGFGTTGWVLPNHANGVRGVAASYQMQADDEVVLASGANTTITLPTGATLGQRHTIRNTGADPIKVGPAVDYVELTLAGAAFATVVWDGSKWRRIG